MRSYALPTLVFALSLPCLASAQAPENQAEPASEPRFSLSLERVLSASAVFFSIDDGNDELKLRSKGITAGGPIANPLSAPRLSLDYLSKSGITLGAGLAFALGDMDSEEHGRDRDEGGYNLIMIAPRVGYRIEAADWLDLTPRAGVTLGWASMSSGEYEYCDYEYDYAYNNEYNRASEHCETAEGDKLKLFAAVVNLELAAAFRLTPSFNILAGLSYDLLVAARAKEEEGGPHYPGDTDETAKFKNGHLSSLQLWFGLGGYL